MIDRYSEWMASISARWSLAAFEHILFEEAIPQYQQALVAGTPLQRKSPSVKLPFAMARRCRLAIRPVDHSRCCCGERWYCRSVAIARLSAHLACRRSRQRRRLSNQRT